MKLLVVAAGGLAREALTLVALLGRHDEVVVLDDDPVLWGTELAPGAPVQGGLDLVTTYDDHELLVCAGRGSARASIVARLDEHVDRARYATVVHPDVAVPPSCRIGRGSIVLDGVVLTADVTVGEHVVVMPHATLTHDDVVEDYATICAGVSLGGHVRVGEAAYLGMNASVRERLVVGAGSTLGMGSALVTDLPAGETWVGTPARALIAANTDRRG